MINRIKTVPKRKQMDLKQALHLKAAEYWLGLGEWEEAEQELEKITCKNPEVARVQKAVAARVQLARDFASGNRVPRPRI